MSARSGACGPSAFACSAEFPAGGGQAGGPEGSRRSPRDGNWLRRQCGRPRERRSWAPAAGELPVAAGGDDRSAARPGPARPGPARPRAQPAPCWRAEARPGAPRELRGRERTGVSRGEASSGLPWSADAIPGLPRAELPAPLVPVATAVRQADGDGAAGFGGFLCFFSPLAAALRAPHGLGIDHRCEGSSPLRGGPYGGSCGPGTGRREPAESPSRPVGPCGSEPLCRPPSFSQRTAGPLGAAGGCARR